MMPILYGLPRNNPLPRAEVIRQGADLIGQHFQRLARAGAMRAKPRDDQRLLALLQNRYSGLDRLHIPGYSATHSDSIWPPKPEYPATCGALR